MTTLMCPSCDETVDARRSDWNDLTDLREAGWISDELEMGAHHCARAPNVHFYRRIRRCSNCQHVYATAEVAERRLDALAELPNEEAKRLSSSVNRMRKLLGHEPARSRGQVP